MRSGPGFWRRQPTSWHQSWLLSTEHLFNRPHSRRSGRRRTLSPPSRRETTPQLATIALFRWHRSLRRWWNASSARQWCINLDINDVLHDAQHGFRKIRSCETQLLLSADDFLKTLDKNVQTDAILLDFSKAFDRVAHKHLLKTLEATGVTGTTLGWISSFLNDREHTFVLEGMSSDSKPVTSVVPQGTVLGPLLFLIYINDLPNCVNSSTIRLCADHCLIYKEIHSQHDTEDLQTDLDALQTWERRWLMSFHPQKCQLLRITRKPSPITAQYNIHGHVLEVADTA